MLKMIFYHNIQEHLKSHKEVSFKKRAVSEAQGLMFLNLKEN